MNLHFDCTQCGKCCHDLKLLLTIDEAMAWSRRGGRVQLLCEAIPWIEEPQTDNLQALYKKERSFPASSGSLSIRVVVILVAAFSGGCPNLGADMRCGIYSDRPAVCRIYPAEINPFAEIAPDNKACPPEAWSESHPLFLQEGTIADTATRALINVARNAAVTEVEARQRLCLALAIDVASLVNEGFVIHTPKPALFFAALSELNAPAGEATPWHIASNRHDTIGMLEAAGASWLDVGATEAAAFEYLGFFPAS
jgi:Fe-S-cluster containining protein